MKKGFATIEFGKKPKKLIDLSNKKKLEQIVNKIPKDKDSLFAFPVNWELAQKANLIESKIRPWVTARSKEYMGTEEPMFINMVISRLKKKESAKKIMKKVKFVLEEDTEVFVMKLWRMMIFQLLKAEAEM